MNTGCGYKIGQVRPYIEVLLIILQGKKARAMAQAVLVHNLRWFYKLALHRKFIDDYQNNRRDKNIRFHHMNLLFRT